METGVLDSVPFMNKLKAMGYDGPVTVEPFSQKLNDLAANDPSAAIAATAKSLDTLWRAAGL
jgi:sugar phosphate isomerase/epimerase